jgi:hypothetical protein
MWRATNTLPPAENKTRGQVLTGIDSNWPWLFHLSIFPRSFRQQIGKYFIFQNFDGSDGFEISLAQAITGFAGPKPPAGHMGIDFATSKPLLMRFQGPLFSR